MPSVTSKGTSERIREVFSIPNVWLFDVSRDGRTAAIVSNRTGSLQLYALPLVGGAPRPLSHGKDRVIVAKISHDSAYAAFTRDFGGKEDYQIFHVPLRGGREKALTRLPPTRIFDLAWSHSDDRIAFSGANREFNGLWLVDAATGVAKDVYRAPGWVFGPSWSYRDETICVAAKTTEEATAAELVFIDPSGGEPTAYTPKAGSENANPSWHPREASVLFKTDARGQFDLAVHDVEGNAVRYLRAGMRGRDFPFFDWTPDGESVYYVATKEGRSRLFVEHVDGGHPREVLLPTGNHIPRMGPDGAFVAVAWSSLSSPHEVARYDFGRRRPRPLLHQRAGLQLGKAEHVVYRSFDRLPIHGWFLRPPGARGRLPSVLWIHGGPAWEVADEWNPAIQALVTAGYSLFAPNIRGSTGYGAKFEHLNIRDVGGGDLKDVAAAAAYLRRRPDVDPKRIAIVGASYGGYMTFLAMTKLADLWAAGAAIVGITDWREMYELSDAAFRSFIERYFGKPAENPELYRDRSPIHFVDNVRAPLLIWHRGNDSRCPLAPVKKFAKRLEEAGKAYEMTVVWDEGHGWQKTANLVRQYTGVVKFLSKHLAM